MKRIVTNRQIKDVTEHQPFRLPQGLIQNTGMGMGRLTTRVLLAITSFFIFVLNNDLTELLLLLLFDGLATFLNHMHFLVVFHHFSQIIVGSEVGNAMFLQHLASLYGCLHRSLVTIRYTYQSLTYKASSRLISSSGSLISSTSTEMSRVSFQGSFFSILANARFRPSYRDNSKYQCIYRIFNHFFLGLTFHEC